MNKGVADASRPAEPALRVYDSTGYFVGGLLATDCIVEKIAIVVPDGFKLFYPIAWLKQIHCWKPSYNSLLGLIFGQI